jgi:hypothetical protein
MTSSGWNRQDRRAMWIIAAVFLVASIYPFLRAEPQLDLEIGIVRKMLDYGFARRAGAMMFPQFNNGRLAHPEAFNYTHHPYLTAWAYGIVYEVSGFRGVSAFTLVMGLVGCLVVYRTLRTTVDSPAALAGSVLYACAPVLLLTTVRAFAMVFATIFWPAATWVALPPPEGASWRRNRTWLLGLLSFLGMQISWASLGVVPSLLLMTAEPAPGFRATLRNPRCRAILLGTGLGLAVFIVQVIAYTTSFHEPVGYVAFLAKPGATGFAQTRSRMLLALVVRTVVLVGPALILGSVAAGLMLWRTRKTIRLANGMILYILLWLAGAVSLTFLFTREKWVYVWLLFPAAALAAYAWEQTSNRILRGLLLALTIPGLVYAQLTASLPQKSRAAETLAVFLQQQTRPEDLILTNLKPQVLPFPYWDYNGPDTVAVLADRLCWGGIDSVQALEIQKELMKGQVARVLYLLGPTPEIPGDLEVKLHQEGQLLQHVDIELTPEIDSFGLRLRRWYGKIQGKPVIESQSGSRRFTAELYVLNPQ